MNSKLIQLAVAGIFAASAGIANAEEAYQGSWYVVPGIGIMHADKDLEAEDTAPAVSLRVGKEISEHWDVQLGVSHGRADSNDSAIGLPLSGKYKQTLLGVDALYLFSRDKLRPFLLAGLGVAHNDVDYTFNNVPVSGSKTSWMANVGAGVQYFITENIGLQADVRHVWSRAKASAFNPANGFGATVSDTVGNTYLNFGVIFDFGAPKPAVAAVEPTAPMEEVKPVEEPALPPMQEAEAPAETGPAQPAFEKITLASEVLFAFDKDVLKEEGKQKLNEEVVEKMKAHPEVELVLITGHTDRIGSDKYNQSLSERRANQVKKYLASQGIEESRLHAVGKGESEPVEACKGVHGKKLISCLQPNRRVVVEIEVQKQQ